MLPRSKLVTLGLLLLIITLACENLSSLTPATVTATLRPSATTIPDTPTPAFTPTPTPFPGRDVQSLCFSVERTGMDNNSSGDMEELLFDVFIVGMNLTGGACDATLTITVAYDARSAEYKDEKTGKYKTCYTGTSANGEMVFEKTGSEPMVFKISKNIAPFSGKIYTCPSLKYADLDAAWGPEVVDGLYAIYGPEVLGHLIFHGLVWGSPRVQMYAESKLKSLGEKGMPAVPVILAYLFQRYGDKLPEFTPTSSSALNALKQITGQDFGRDVTAWQAWWNNQPSP